MKAISRVAVAATKCSVTLLMVASPVSSHAQWESYEKPFAVDSMWNSRPVRPVLGDFQIPPSDYSPAVSEGPYSTAAFLARSDDKPQVVIGLPGKTGVWDPDAEIRRDVTIPRWPAQTVPATGNDGHADIIDPVAGVIHSFYQLKQVDGQWRATQYAWTRLNGRGWGDPSHYYQGARAAAVPSIAGMIRKHEVNDGDTQYRHALAMSLTFNGLAAQPTYVFPATSADWNAATAHTGGVPEGALLMLPASFDTARMRDPALRKVAETLKTYGAYVVDRNQGTPFAIYVENGSGFSLHRGGWNNATAADLDEIRKALRQVVSTDGWVDGNGRNFSPARNLNLLSMRGPWTRREGQQLGVFDTWKQAVVFAEGTGRVVQTNWSGRAVHPVTWAQPVKGKKYRVTSKSTNGGLLRVQIVDKGTNKFVFDSGDLAAGASVDFAWPQDANFSVVTTATNPAGAGATVSGTLLAIE